jgi:hypothetical protein
MAKLEFNPLPSTKSLRRLVPEPFGATKHNIHIVRGNDACSFFVGDCKAMREVEGFAFCEVLLHGWPYSYLRGVRKQIEDNWFHAARASSIEKSVFAFYPSILKRLFIRFGWFALPYDYIKAVVSSG